MAERIFLREVRLENINKTLLFYQSSVGNVSCVVWDAALVLTKYLEKRCTQNDLWLKGLKVVELGAGLGCVGITAACYGANVTLTDLPEVIPQLEKTIELNRTSWSNHGSVSATALNWGAERSATLDLIKPPDVLLLSDCVYYEESLAPLIETMKLLCTPSTEVILCQEMRDTGKQKEFWKSFMTEFYNNFYVTNVPASEQDEVYASQDILIFKAKKK